MVFEIVGALRREFAGQFDIARYYLGDRGRHRRHHRQSCKCRIGRAVQQHRGARSGLGYGARRVGGLALLQDSAAGQHHGAERLGLTPAARRRSCMSAIAATAPSTSPAVAIQPAPSFVVNARDRGPEAATQSGIVSRVLIRPSSGLSNRISRLFRSSSTSTVSPRNNDMTMRMYSSMSASLIAPSPIARLPVKPVPTPKSIRPGANLFSEAKALAVTGAIRCEGISTPVPSRIFVVFTAAAAIATNGSALSICVS